MIIDRESSAMKMCANETRMWRTKFEHVSQLMKKHP